jgi:CopG antitoxin of type II toxin-antitoxin system
MLTGTNWIMADHKKHDPIPKYFRSVTEAAQYWDTHDLTDYWDKTSEAHFEVDLQRRVFLTALEPELAKEIAVRAHQQGVSSETLINVWLNWTLIHWAF